MYFRRFFKNDKILRYKYKTIRVAPDTDLAGYPAAGYPANIFAGYPVSGQISGRISGLIVI